MKFHAALVVIAALVSAAQACKCGGNVDVTRGCCTYAGGVTNDDDCTANTISEQLSSFHSCCSWFNTRSDCSCPVGCVRREVQAARKAGGLPAFNETEMLAFLANHEDYVN